LGSLACVAARRSGSDAVWAAAAPQQPAKPVAPKYVPANRSAAGAPAPGADKPSLLSRIGRGLKSLVTRTPSKQH